MKRCKHITGWTDYPFTELGDIAHQKAPIRHIHVLSYDNNKYATITVVGEVKLLYVKAGYIYSKKTRSCAGVHSINILKLERMHRVPIGAQYVE